jgi:hypothetical protein
MMKPWKFSINQSTQQWKGKEGTKRERTPSPSQKIKTQSESQKSTATNHVLKPHHHKKHIRRERNEKGVNVEEPSLATTSCLKIKMTSALCKATSALCKAVDILCLEKTHKIDDLSSRQSY